MSPDRRPVGIGAALLLATLAACAPAKPTPPKTEQIVIDQLAFGPAPAELHVGDTIKWVNRDMFEHTATAKDGQFDVDLPPGASVSVQLRRPGAVDYYCKFHPGMTGRLDVSE